MEKIGFILLFAFLLATLKCTKSFKIKKQKAMNFRQTPLIQPIVDKPDNKWILVYTDFNSSWHNISEATYPFVPDYNFDALKLEFNVQQKAHYLVSLRIRSGSISNNISFSVIEETLVIEQSKHPINIFTFQKLFNQGNNRLQFWIQPGLILEDISLQLSKKHFPTPLKFYHYPYKKQLVIKTDINLPELGQSKQRLIQSAHVQLKMRHHLGDSCLKSVGSANNPANFANYSMYTDFNFLQRSYSIQQIPQDHEKHDSGDLVLLIKNILIDCSVEIEVIFPDVIYDYYLTQFHLTYSPIQYNQLYIPIDVRVKMIYKVNDHVFSVSLIGLEINQLWNRTQIMKKITFKIDGAACQLYYISSYSPPTHNETQIACRPDDHQIIYKSSEVELSIQDDYLRKPHTYQLMKVRLPQDKNQWKPIYFQKWIKGSKVTRISFYQKNLTLRIQTDIQTYQHWDRDSILKIVDKIIVDDKVISHQHFQYDQSNKMYTIQGRVWPISEDSKVECLFKEIWFQTNEQEHKLKFANFGVNTVPLTYIKDPNFVPPKDEQDEDDHKQKNNFDDVEVSQQVMTSVQLIQNYADSMGMLFFGYLINSLIAFKDLSFLFYFVNFQCLLDKQRKEVSAGVILLEDESSMIGIANKILGTSINIELPEVEDQLETVPIGRNYNRLWDFGYSSRFLNNNFDGMLVLSFALVKIFLIYLLSRIPITLVRRFLLPLAGFWRELLLTEIIMICPPLLLGFSAHFGVYPLSINSISSKVNLGIIITCSFFCSCSCFILYLREMETRTKVNSNLKVNALKDETEDKKYKSVIFKLPEQTTDQIKQASKVQKQMDLEKETNAPESSKRRNILGKQTPFCKEFIFLVDNMMYILIPFVVGIGSSTLLVHISLLISFTRLILVLKRRKQFNIGEFIREILSKSIWILFTLIYFTYWLFDITKQECPLDSTCFKVLVFLDEAETYVFLGGCILEIVMALLTIAVEVFFELKKIVADKCKKLKIKSKNVNKFEVQKNISTFKLKMKSHKNVEKVDNFVKSSFDSSFVDKKVKKSKKKFQFLKFTTKE